MLDVAVLATESFQCCEAGNNLDGCKSCTTKCRQIKNALWKSTTLAKVIHNTVSITIDENTYKYPANLSTKFAGGGFSTIFSTPFKTTRLKRGESRRTNLLNNHDKPIVLKTCSANDADMFRALLIENVISNEIGKLNLNVVRPKHPLFRLPMQQFEPRFLLCTIYERYDGDMLELLIGHELGNNDMFFTYAIICETLQTLIDQFQFQHRDLKFENIFFNFREKTSILVHEITYNPNFMPYIADCGMSSAQIDNNHVGCDFWSSSVDSFIMGGDMCFLTMCLLSSETQLLKRTAAKFHQFLWALVGDREDVQAGILSMREECGDDILSTDDSSSSETSFDSDDVDGGEINDVDVTMADKKRIRKPYCYNYRSIMGRAGIGSSNFDRAMYILTNKSNASFPLFEPKEILLKISSYLLLETIFPTTPIDKAMSDTQI